MELSKLSKRQLLKLVYQLRKEVLILRTKQVKIGDIIKEYEETNYSPTQYLRKIGNVVRYGKE